MPTKTKAPTYIGSRKAAEILGVHLATFNRWAQTGKVPSTLQGDGIRGQRWFDKADIEKLAKDRAS